jgi:hypothetical protein
MQIIWGTREQNVWHIFAQSILSDYLRALTRDDFTQNVLDFDALTGFRPLLANFSQDRHYYLIPSPDDTAAIDGVCYHRCGCVGVESNGCSVKAARHGTRGGLRITADLAALINGTGVLRVDT